jgi:hypothetical protein
LSHVSVRSITSRLWSVISSLTMTALEVRDLTSTHPILRCEISFSIMTGMEDVFIPVRLLNWTPPWFVLLNLDQGTYMDSMGIPELTTLTVLVAHSTELSGWLTACCLACSLWS